MARRTAKVGYLRDGQRSRCNVSLNAVTDEAVRALADARGETVARAALSVLDPWAKWALRDKQRRMMAEDGLMLFSANGEPPKSGGPEFPAIP